MLWFVLVVSSSCMWRFVLFFLHDSVRVIAYHRTGGGLARVRGGLGCNFWENGTNSVNGLDE